MTLTKDRDDVCRSMLQYAWYFSMHAGHDGTLNGACYDVTDDIRSQRYIPGTGAPSTDAAADPTWVITLTKSGALFPTSYQATLTGESSEGCGSGLSSYPNVMSQWGSQNCAIAGANFDFILSTYYRGSQLVQAGAGTFVAMARTPAGTSYYLLGSR